MACDWFKLVGAELVDWFIELIGVFCPRDCGLRGRTEVMEESSEEGNLRAVGRVVLVLSGKGGVGKSTITTELALALQHAGKKVGILDVDLCGPSIPRMLGVSQQEVHQCDSGWVPVYADPQQRLALMSIGFLLDDPSEAVVWRGPKKTALIGQFVRDVAWGELDVLLVDTPPGTSDEHLAVLENLRKHRVDGAVLVTTPQAVSIGDVRREITFCKKTGVKILGIVENMSGFVCPHCISLSLSVSLSLYLSLCISLSLSVGSVPLDPLLAESIEEGRDFLQAFPESATYSSLRAIAESVLTRLQD
ncbi:cytosolic Fe-S cluster assembly factor nubp2 [Astyanax mexicanus]|uniref:Cytosolic Fe-S cluster assembly factor nubp2 n=1 Tax=Astyanax mexicanus TaxID=7994 RepID=A0A8T2M7C5_ASTMX|nr:cytosolic Fe-S cluster assembly factor nubp2 [Astyanax mexicanus]